MAGRIVFFLKDGSGGLPQRFTDIINGSIFLKNIGLLSNCIINERRDTKNRLERYREFFLHSQDNLLIV